MRRPNLNYMYALDQNNAVILLIQASSIRFPQNFEDSQDPGIFHRSTTAFGIIFH